MSTIDEKTKTRLQKLLQLAKHGVDGEQWAAQAKLDTLCHKYGVCWEELECQDEIKMRWFKHAREPHYARLMSQCIFKVIGGNRGYDTYKHGINKKEIGVKCTATEAVEIELDYQFYADELCEGLKQYTQAFIQKNRIFPDDVHEDNKSTTTTPECTEEFEHLVNGVKRTTRKLGLGDGNDSD